MKNNSFKQIKQISIDIKKSYDEINYKDGHKKWQVSDYTMGMIGDCGDLCKLIMAKNNLRISKSNDLDKDIEHELVDILWSLIAIADELNIDLEKVSITHLNILKARVEQVKIKSQPKNPQTFLDSETSSE